MQHTIGTLRQDTVVDIEKMQALTGKLELMKKQHTEFMRLRRPYIDNDATIGMRSKRKRIKTT